MAYIGVVDLICQIIDSKWLYLCYFFVIGTSLSEPHSNVENGMVVYVQRTAAKKRIATHYYSGGSCTYVQTNTINLYRYFHASAE